MTTKPALYASLRTTGSEIVGEIRHSTDSALVLEAIAAIIEEFAKSCGVPAREICDDLKEVVQ